MASRDFRELLANAWAAKKFVCVGLDTDFEKIPESFKAKNHHSSIGQVIYAYNEKIIEATYDLVGAYKINLAFYSEHGRSGTIALRNTVMHILARAPHVLIILDAKYADIGNTNKGYVRTAFNVFHADAVTVNPYFGEEALGPFLAHRNKLIIILCRTSNSGGREFQDRLIALGDHELEVICKNASLKKSLFGEEAPHHVHLYEYVALRVWRYWNNYGNCGLVVGATCPNELERVRQIVPGVPLLVPGIGAQGAEIEIVVRGAITSEKQGALFNVSRSVIFASNDENFASAARAEVMRLNSIIGRVLEC